jgi:uncharacterized protein (DUF1800 family)
MPIPLQTRNRHLLWRAGFGPAAGMAQALADSPTHHTLKALEADSRRPFLPLTVPTGTAQPDDPSGTTSPQDRQRRNRERIRQLNIAWIDRMVSGEQMLREKMALFWHGHFAARHNNPDFVEGLLNAIREHALGDFGTLLRKVCQSPAMLAFLNNQQNRKQRPNENFARELMELFTLGRGHYTEADVRDAARAFTGWQFDAQGSFRFRAEAHDDGPKTILGVTGRLTGDDVIGILLDRRETADAITRKIWRHFVDEQVDEAAVQRLSRRFFASRYDIAGLMHDIFASEAFHEPRHIGRQIKSPVELIVGIRRMLPMRIGQPEVQILLQRILGQVLFYPPNVAGWPGGRHWIDGASLMYRLRIPQMVAQRDWPAPRAKDDDDQDMGTSRRPGRGSPITLDTRIDWEPVYQSLTDVKRERLPEAVAALLWQTTTPPDVSGLDGRLDASSREALIRSTFIRLMGSPEYQLC